MEESRFELFSSLVSSASRSVHRIKSEQVKQYSLTGAHTTCLCRLSAAGKEGLTQGQLSSLDNMDRAQISRVLSQLMRQNFVTAAEHSGLYNKRYILTEMGQALVDDFCVNLEKIQTVVSGGISQTDLEIFYRTLQTITRNLEQAVSTYQCDPVEN